MSLSESGPGVGWGLGSGERVTAIVGQLLSFLDEFALEDLEELADAIVHRSKTAMRERIRALPDGRFPYKVTIDGFEKPLDLNATIIVEGDELTVDFAGSPEPMPLGINVTLDYTAAYTPYGVKCALAGDIPNNEGSFIPGHVTAPEGSQRASRALPPSVEVDAACGQSVQVEFEPEAGAVGRGYESVPVEHQTLPDADVEPANRDRQLEEIAVRDGESDLQVGGLSEGGAEAVALAPEPERRGEVGERAQLGDAVSCRIHAYDVERPARRRSAVVPCREPYRVRPRDGGLEPASQLPPALQVLVRERILEPTEVEFVEYMAKRTSRVSIVQSHRVHHEVHVVSRRPSGCATHGDVGVEIAANMELDRPEPGIQQLVDHCLAVLCGFDGRSARAAPDAIAPPAEHVRDGKVHGARREIPQCHVHDPKDGERQADSERAPERGEDARPIERVRARQKRRGRFLDGGYHRAGW